MSSIADAVSAGEFGFEVKRWTDPSNASTWRVSLPHSCRRWCIAGKEDQGLPRADAVLLVLSFVEQALLALQALQREEELNVDRFDYVWDINQ